MFVVVKELPEIFEFELPVFFSEEKTDPTRPLSVPSNTSQTSVGKEATCIPTCSTMLDLRWLKSIPRLQR